MSPKQVGPSRAIAPKGIGMRKVRAPQGRITDNVRRRRLPGKCNRNKPPHSAHRVQAVRMERRGKSSPAPWQHRANVNPIRSNTVCGQTLFSVCVCPTQSRRWLEVRGDAHSRQMTVMPKGIQNPAYRLTFCPCAVYGSWARHYTAFLVFLYLKVLFEKVYLI